MSFVSKLFGDGAERSSNGTHDYIDLTDYAVEEGSLPTGSTMVRFARLRTLEDIRQFAKFVYDGSLLILDFAAVADDEITLRRLTNELRHIAQDVGGDVALISHTQLMLTPRGVRFDGARISIHPETGALVQERRAASAAQAAPAPKA